MSPPPTPPDPMPEPDGKVSVPAAWRDLGPRLVSGLVLAAIALLAEALGGWAFALLVALFAIVMCWEWGRIVRGTEEIDATLALHAGAVALAVILAAVGLPALAMLAVVIGAIILVARHFGGGGTLTAAGVVYVGLPAVCLLWLRGDDPYGATAVLFIIAAVAATDIGAYIAGRALGGPKLWPRVSPNKTWAGLIGGVSAAVVVGIVFSLFISGAVPARMALTGLALGLVSQGGDLAESALKRGHGVKDASSLIPGHGGVLDRLDGLVAAAALAGLIGILLNARAPARALLFWF